MHVRALSKALELGSDNLTRLILLCNYAEWPTTPAYPCTAHTQRARSSKCFESRSTWILSKFMFSLPKHISENQLHEPTSFRREIRREKIMKAPVKQRQLWRVQLTVWVRQVCNPQQLKPCITIYISKMWNGSGVITQRLSNSEQQQRSFQKLPEAPEQAECTTLCCSGILKVHSGAPQCFWSSWTE